MRIRRLLLQSPIKTHFETISLLLHQVAEDKILYIYELIKHTKSIYLIVKISVKEFLLDLKSNV